MIHSGDLHHVGRAPAAPLADRDRDVVVGRDLHDGFGGCLARPSRREPVGGPGLDVFARPEVVEVHALGTEGGVPVRRESEERVRQLDDPAGPEVLEGHRRVERVRRGHFQRADRHDANPLRIRRGVEVTEYREGELGGRGRLERLVTGGHHRCRTEARRDCRRPSPTSLAARTRARRPLTHSHPSRSHSSDVQRSIPSFAARWFRTWSR